MQVDETVYYCMENDMDLLNPFLTRKEAALYLGIKPETLDRWACTKKYKIKYTKIGRLTKYRKEDLDSFIAERTVNGDKG